jgi:hypothetical protein
VYGTLILLLLLSSLRVAPLLLRAQGRSVTTSLVVQVAEAALLERQNDNVILKVRLARGVAVSLWADKSCTAPAVESYIITASGTYTIPLNQINQGLNAEAADQGSICLQSSDGVLRRSLPVIEGALQKGAMTDDTKSASRSTWSGHVSIPAPPVPSAKNSLLLRAH